MRFYQVSSFTEYVFCGNPAGVCLLGKTDRWPDSGYLQNVAAQINLSETVFVLQGGGEFFLRWFTPAVEVDLCGHATLAAAHVLFDLMETDSLVFRSKLYNLPVVKENEKIVLDFPMAKITRLESSGVPQCFNFSYAEVWTGHDEYMLVFDSEEKILDIQCDFEKAKNIELSGFIVTAKSSRPGTDFVSRYFAPKIGINEDPVTGSAHTLLVPYWQEVMGKNEFHAKQLSKRGGDLHCVACGDRVKIAGNAVTFLSGEISV